MSCYVWKQLSIDFYRRKSRYWPLIEEDDWNKFKEPDLKATSCLQFKGHNITTAFNMEKFNENFHLIQPLLDMFYGKIAICGGFYTAHRDRSESIRDVDIFFHNCTQEEAESILKQSVIFLVQNYNKDNPIIIRDEQNQRWNTINNVKIQVEHRLYVTNVVMIYCHHDNIHGSGDTPLMIRKYQFIHRLYPNLGTILGGFDISASMVAWTGRELLTTELGASSLSNGIIYVDISRRSTTFGNRLDKYKRRGFDIVFPGFSKDTKFFIQDDDINQRIHQVKALMKKLNIKFVTHGGFYRDYDGYYNECGNSKGHLIDASTDEITFLDFKLTKPHYIVHTKSSKIKEPEQYKEENTDYGDWTSSDPDMIRITNTSLLINNKIESVITVLFHDELSDKSYIDLSLIYDEMLEEPFIINLKIEAIFDDVYNENPFRKYAEFGDRALALINSFNHNSIIEIPTRLLACEELQQIVNTLNIRLESNLVTAQEKLKGIHWIEQDPGRQWTSSVNPQIVSAVDFYKEQFYRPFWVVIPEEIESYLRLLRKTRGNVWYMISRDVFNAIIKALIFM